MYAAEFVQTALQGEAVSEVLDGPRRFDLVVKLQEPYRSDYARLKELRIDPEAVDPDDAELLQDMVLAAVNEALRSAQELAATKMDQAAGGLGGLGLPGL